MGRAKLHAIRERYVASKAKFCYTTMGHKSSSIVLYGLIIILKAEENNCSTYSYTVVSKKYSGIV